MMDTREWCCRTPLDQPHVEGCAFEPRPTNPVDYDGPTLLAAATGAKVVDARPRPADEKLCQCDGPDCRRKRELSGALHPPRGYWLGVFGRGPVDGMIGPWPTREAALAALDEVRVYVTGYTLTPEMEAGQ